MTALSTPVAAISTPRDKWQILPIPEEPEAQKLAIRLNALGSLYFFIKFVLQRSRLTDSLHRPFCESLEKQNLRCLKEMPRDHFKTTITGEGFPMWRALPFNERDEIAMRELGYGDEWIAWMNYAHRDSIRILTVSESIGNSAKIGMRLDNHFQQNSIFRETFPEILPTEKSTWNMESKHQNHRGLHAHGEGTFDYLGVGGALQSRHYDLVLPDDLVGQEAAESEPVMEKTINYYKLIEGAFDGPGEQVVTGNRWSPRDLNGWIRENEKDVEIESHSAYGGCCERHPDGIPIFPEEFPPERLERIRAKQGPYIFSHQYLNLPLLPEECVFSKDWLRFYGPTPAKDGTARHLLRHEVAQGEVIPDLNPNYLMRSMIVDPNHAGASGRAHHAIVITGVDPETDRIYLLDVWAASASYDDLLSKVYSTAELWGLSEFWLETVAAQKYLKYHIEYRNKVEKRRLSVRELKSDNSKNAKRTRIDAMAPLFQANRVWVRRDQAAFLEEYYAYPGGRTVDVLDALSYSPSTWNAIHAKRIRQMLDERKNRHLQRSRTTGY